MKTERTFNVFNKITADWDEIDNLIQAIIDADTDNEIDIIGISMRSVKDGVLCDNFTPIAAGKNIPGYDIETRVSFRNMIEWTRTDMLSDSFITLWKRV